MLASSCMHDARTFTYVLHTCLMHIHASCNAMQSHWRWRAWLTDRRISSACSCIPCAHHGSHPAVRVDKRIRNHRAADGLCINCNLDDRSPGTWHEQTNMVLVVASNKSSTKRARYNKLSKHALKQTISTCLQRTYSKRKQYVHHLQDIKPCKQLRIHGKPNTPAFCCVNMSCYFVVTNLQRATCSYMLPQGLPPSLLSVSAWSTLCCGRCDNFPPCSSHTHLCAGIHVHYRNMPCSTIRS